MSNSKTVLITGVTGQMGSTMSDMLLDEGHSVVGTIRRLSVTNHRNIEHLKTNYKFKLETMDLSDAISIDKVIERHKPDYLISCAANSFVGNSWDMPEQHMDINALGVLRILESLRKYAPKCRSYYFGSSEEFGDVQFSPQTEEHPLRARSPYGASKIAARQLVKVYRESYNMYAVQGWSFNFEGPRRGDEFVTQKIVKGLVSIKNDLVKNVEFKPLELGNIYAKRDWNHAVDTARGVWMMLNQRECRLAMAFKKIQSDFPDMQIELRSNENDNFVPKEYILSSGITHSIKDFINICLNKLDIKGEWRGEGLEEKFVNVDNTVIVQINEKFYRPAEVELLIGNSTKINKDLGWEPLIPFEWMVNDMIQFATANFALAKNV